jgi:capsid protein
MANHIYRLWLEERINAGAVPIPRGMGAEIFYDPIKREALCAAEWIGASRGQIDELKETQAAVMRINSGLSTYEKECARLGEDFRRIFRQRSRENRLMKELDLTFSTEATKPGKNDAQQTMRSEDETDQRTTERGPS